MCIIIVQKELCLKIPHKGMAGKLIGGDTIAICENYRQCKTPKLKVTQ